MENDENLVSIKTEKISGKLTIHIPLTLMFWQSMGITHMNQLKGIYFPKVKKIVELISCQTSDAIPVICVPKGH